MVDKEAFLAQSSRSDTLELLELRMRNFMSYGNNYTTVDLTTPGTTLIVGEDLDSGTGSANGVGKTTILNGIVYGLYDKPLAKEIKLDRLINNINKKNMEVHLKFRKFGDVYEISRFRKGKDGNTVVLTKNGTAITRDSVDQTNQFIEDVIGYSYDLFVRIVVFSAAHEAFLDLPTSGAKKPTQTDIMEELFDLTSLSEKAERAKKEIKATEQRMEVFKAKIEQIEREKERHDTQIETTKRMIIEWEDSRKGKIERLKADLKKLDGIDFEKEQKLHKQLATLLPQRKEMRAAIERATEWEDTHQVKTIRVMKELKKLQAIDFKKELQYHKQLSAATKRFSELETAHKNFTKFEAALMQKSQQLTQELVELELIDFDKEKALHVSLADKQSNLKTLNTELEHQVREKGDKLQTYEKLSTESKHLFDATCPYCLQHFAGAKEKAEKINDVIADLGKDLKTFDAAITKKNTAIAELAAEIVELKDQIKVKSLTDLSKMQSDKESIEQRLAEIGTEVNPHKEAIEALMQMDVVDSVLLATRVKADLTDLQTQITEAKEQITVDSADDVIRMQSELTSLEQRFEELTSEMNPHIAPLEKLVGESINADDLDKVSGAHLDKLMVEIQDIQSQITVDDIEELLETKNNSSTMEIRIKELGVESNPYETTLSELMAVNLDEAQYDAINEMTKVVEHHKFLVKLLTKSDSFVRKNLIEENIPFLNKQLRENLKDLGLPHKVEFTNTMTASISQLGRELDFGNLSRGQKARVNLALAWAFRDVLQSMHGAVNFCLLDEVLDVGLCQVGVVMAAKMLKNRARRDKTAMFIISHKQEVDSVFDRTMKIQLYRGFSRVAIEGETI